jgi:ribosomal protein L21
MPPFTRKKGHKYNATKVEIDGITFDSKLEANCYTVLKASGLKYTRQDVFEIQEKFKDGKKTIQPIRYHADFSIITPEHTYVVDAKGMITPEFALKRKLLLYRGTRVICCGSMKKMTVLCQMIKEGKDPQEVQIFIEAKKKKTKKNENKS